MGYLSVLLVIIGLVTYIQDQKHIALIVLVTLITSYFGFVDDLFFLGPISLQHGDLALLFIFLLLPLKELRVQKNLKGIQNTLFLFLVFVLCSVAYDYFFRGTSLIQIFRTTRKLGYLLFFFLLPAFNWQDYRKLLKYLLIVTTVHSGLYISQYIFGYSYTPHLDLLYDRTHTNELGEARYTNVPYFLIPLFVLSMFSNYFGKFKWYIVGLFVLAIVLGQGRGAIISMIIAILGFLILEKGINWVNILVFPILGSFVAILFFSYFPILGERFTQMFNEVLLVQEMDYNNLNAFYHEGSLIFRWGVTYERFMYVLESPIRMLLGVGYFPDMDITRPIFVLGTKSDVLPTGFEQYNTVDIFFPNIITRYGFLGSGIFLFLIYRLLSFGFRNRNYKWGKILLTYLCVLCIISFVSETFYNTENFIFIFVLIRIMLIEQLNAKSKSPSFNKMIFS